METGTTELRALMKMPEYKVLEKNVYDNLMKAEAAAININRKCSDDKHVEDDENNNIYKSAASVTARTKRRHRNSGEIDDVLSRETVKDIAMLVTSKNAHKSSLFNQSRKVR